MSQPRVRRPGISESLQPAHQQNYTVRKSLQVERVSVQAMGGTGLRLATHYLAASLLDGLQPSVLHLDSDHGETFATRIPGGEWVQLSPSQQVRFGVDDPRAELRKRPEMQRRYQRLLHGIPVSQTYRRGAAQARPYGLIQYDLSIGAVRAALNADFDRFYPSFQGRGRDGRGRGMGDVLAHQQAQAQAEQPLLMVYAGSGVGGQGSAVFGAHAYVARHELAKRNARNVTHIGILLGPKAFAGRESQLDTNYAATLRELEAMYCDGFDFVFSDGERVSSDKPPFDQLFLVDLPEWPEGERNNDRLSDTAMDDWLRRVAYSARLYTQRTMHDRAQSLLANIPPDPQATLTFGALSAALVHANVDAMIETAALTAARDALIGLAARCQA